MLFHLTTNEKRALTVMALLLVLGVIGLWVL
jgi:hypothetical protein